MYSPKKSIQFKKDYKPYLNSDLLDKIKTSNDFLTEAIKTNDYDNWIFFFRNATMKEINLEKKKEFIIEKSKDMKDKWK